VTLEHLIDPAIDAAVVLQHVSATASDIRAALPLVTKIARGCRLTRDVLLLHDAGFGTDVECAYVSWPRTLGYNFWGSAAVNRVTRSR
jgi:hypothetical protein